MPLTNGFCFRIILDNYLQKGYKRSKTMARYHEVSITVGVQYSPVKL
jgi:hypothetical protein